MTEEEVVNVLVGVFLHPSYTIPLMGCFRPIARHIVDKAVALLRLVPNLRSIPDDTAAEDDRDRVLDGVVNVIEFYSWGQGRGLDLHELACLAFCRALDMGPFLLRLISSLSLVYNNFFYAAYLSISSCFISFSLLCAFVGDVLMILVERWLLVLIIILKNRIVFLNETFNGSKVLDNAILLIWTWLKSKEKDFALHFHQWSTNLREGFCI